MAIPAYFVDKALTKRINQLEDRIEGLESEIDKLYSILEKNGIR